MLRELLLILCKLLRVKQPLLLLEFNAQIVVLLFGLVQGLADLLESLHNVLGLQLVLANPFYFLAELVVVALYLLDELMQMLQLLDMFARVFLIELLEREPQGIEGAVHRETVYLRHQLVKHFDIGVLAVGGFAQECLQVLDTCQRVFEILAEHVEAIDFVAPEIVAEISLRWFFHRR